MAVTNGLAVPVGATAVPVTGSDGTNFRFILTDDTGATRIVYKNTSTGTVTTVAATTVSGTLLAANTARHGFMVFNRSNKVLYLKLAAAATITSYSTEVPSGSLYECPFMYDGIVTGVWATGPTNDAQITELT
jgi:hypothetical protein